MDRKDNRAHATRRPTASLIHLTLTDRESVQLAAALHHWTLTGGDPGSVLFELFRERPLRPAHLVSLAERILEGGPRFDAISDP